MRKNGIGIIYGLADVLEYGADKHIELGLDCVQIRSFDPEMMTRENAEKVKNALEGKIRISSFWAGWSGPKVWDFSAGPQTLGLVPEAYRAMRINEVLKGVDFASWLGVENVATHVGFIPENPSTDEYRGVLEAVRHIAKYCEEKGINFNFETGQETPTTLMRIISDIGTNNVGINLDPANLIMYGKGNPVDALDLFKGKINGVHIKDGDYPTDFYKLGNERVVGEGSVNYPVYLPKLINQGYKGDLYIEREIKGEQQIIDIKKTILYIEKLMSDL